MAERIMDTERKSFYCSTSIANWKDKLQKRFKLPEWHFLKSRGSHAIFFGMYNPVDYARFLWHNGKKTVFWCGTDILNLKKRKVWQRILNLTRATHICENQVEHDALVKMGIESKIVPCLFGSMEGMDICYQPSAAPHVWMVAHEDRKKEYGVDIVEEIAHKFPRITFHIYGIRTGFHELWEETVTYAGGAKINTGIVHNLDYVNQPNVIYHGKVPEDQFNEEIKQYQGCIRLNRFDGFAETLAKSVLMGQYQWSKIPYPYMACDNDMSLRAWLDSLPHGTEPNYAGASYWREKLQESLEGVMR